MSIQVRNLTKKYSGQTAVNAISFDIPSGQVVGFLGPNGAGKSTTMKILTGFISPTSGEAHICELSTEKESIKAKACIGYLPEHNPLYLDMYVREYLQFMARLSGLKQQVKERVEAIIETTGLSGEVNKIIGSLSKGYRQRVGLAQALIHNPKVLILDEPTSGLDPNQVLEIRKLIREIGRDRTVMLSTHVMQEVEAMCDRVIIINKGDIVADDTVKNLQRKSVGKAVVVKFKTAVEIDKLMSIKGVSKAEEVAESTYRLVTEGNDDIQELLFHFAVKNNNVILEQKEEQQSLEHVFRSYTQN
jgi:gliding motility-associated transport system ATP-binding protein